MSSSPDPILLLIDLQQGMVAPTPDYLKDWGPRSTPTLEVNVATLLRTFRAKRYPILHVQHDEISPLEPDNPISARFPETYAPHACAAPLLGEKIIVKHTGSAFIKTELEEELRRLENEAEGRVKRKIVTIGMDGGQCVNSTVRNGIDLGFDHVVVANACASFGIADWESGEQKGAEESHAFAMGMLAGYTKVVGIDDLWPVIGEESLNK